jgi:cytoskeletal protein CcmA (bactofilin family)
VVEGNIRATQLIELHTPGRVKGNLETPSLSIDKGVMFEGSCKMDGAKGGSQTPTPLTSSAPPELPKR